MPSEYELTFDAILVENKVPRQWIIDVPVFTIEEGKSDLTMRMVVTDRPGNEVEIVFYDVWVM